MYKSLLTRIFIFLFNFLFEEIDYLCLNFNAFQVLLFFFHFVFCFFKFTRTILKISYIKSYLVVQKSEWTNENIVKQKTLIFLKWLFIIFWWHITFEDFLFKYKSIDYRNYVYNFELFEATQK